MSCTLHVFFKIQVYVIKYSALDYRGSDGPTGVTLGHTKEEKMYSVMQEMAHELGVEFLTDHNAESNVGKYFLIILIFFFALHAELYLSITLTFIA